MNSKCKDMKNDLLQPYLGSTSYRKETRKERSCNKDMRIEQRSYFLVDQSVMQQLAQTTRDLLLQERDWHTLQSFQSERQKDFGNKKEQQQKSSSRKW